MHKSLLPIFTLPALLLMGVAAYTVQSPSEAQPSDNLGKQANVILEKHCSPCHTEKNYGLLNLRKRAEMLQSGRIVIVNGRGESAKSKLYLRITAPPETRMPPRLDDDSKPTLPLTAEEIGILKAWIEAGAPESQSGISLPVRRSPISNAAMLAAIENDLKGLDEQTQKTTRYFTLTNLYNAGASDTELDRYRAALSKLLNSLSWENEVVVPKPVANTANTVYRIDMTTAYDWHEETWQTILKAYPYGVRMAEGKFATICEQTGCALPFLRADWFVTHAALPPLYEDILKLPQTDRELEEKLGVNVAANLKEAAGKRVWRAGFLKSGVSNHNRVVERHKSQYGAYWKSYDFATGDGNQDIKSHPLDFERSGGELIFNLPNGLQAYMLVKADGHRISQAPTEIVFNKEFKGRVGERTEIFNGLSCMTCHTQGIRENFKDEVRLDAHPSDGDLAKVQRLYVVPALLNDWMAKDVERFRASVMKATGSPPGTEEPIAALTGHFQDFVDLRSAAAELGLSEDSLVKAIQQSDLLKNAGLSSLAREGGKVERETWEAKFGVAATALGLGSYLKPNEAYRKHFASNPDQNNGSGLAQAKINPRDGAKMIWIPAGPFLMGDDDRIDNPRHTTILSGYYIYEKPVTVGMFRKFTTATNYPYDWNSYRPDWGWQEDHPMVNVSSFDGIAYGKWAFGDEKNHLPTAAQWEKAARGTDGRKFVWGEEFDNSKLWCSVQVKRSGTIPPGLLGESSYHVFDMAGNVWQWCADFYEPDYWKNPPLKDPQGPKSGNWRIFRGGSWLHTSLDYYRTAYLGGGELNGRVNDAGFRCASGS